MELHDHLGKRESQAGSRKLGAVEFAEGLENCNEVPGLDSDAIVADLEDTAIGTSDT